MSYKVTKKNEVYNYEAPNHFDCRSTRVHDAADVNGGTITVGLSHFLPGGGCTYGSNAKESVYYVITGEMYLESEVGTPNEIKTTLYAGDSYHCGPGTNKSIINTGNISSAMLVALAEPKKED